MFIYLFVKFQQFLVWKKYLEFQRKLKEISIFFFYNFLFSISTFLHTYKTAIKHIYILTYLHTYKTVIKPYDFTSHK